MDANAFFFTLVVAVLVFLTGCQVLAPLNGEEKHTGVLSNENYANIYYVEKGRWTLRLSGFEKDVDMDIRYSISTNEHTNVYSVNAGLLNEEVAIVAYDDIAVLVTLTSASTNAEPTPYTLTLTPDNK